MTSTMNLKVDDIVVSEKMDGENTTIHCSGTHARSPDSRHHLSRNWIKRFAANISPFLAENERIIGENLFARHSIAYNSLSSYFLGFAWIVGGEVQSWDDTLKRFKTLGVDHVPTLYRGPFKNGLFEELAYAMDMSKQEGFVVRIAGAYFETDMQRYLGKYVRAGHIQSDKHWMHTDLIPNTLAHR